MQKLNSRMHSYATPCRSYLSSTGAGSSSSRWARSVRLREGEISIEEGRIILGVMTLAGGEGGVSLSLSATMSV